MAPTYKLTYGAIKGLAECIRYLLSYGEVEFEDVHISMEDWPKYKKDMPFGQVPILEVDGKTAHQSLAMARYLAKQFKLTGKDDWEDLEIDAIVDTVNDFRLKVGAHYYVSDEAAKAKLRETAEKEVIPYYLDRLEAIAKANKGHLALGKLTWADVHFASLMGLFNLYNWPGILDGRENLQAVVTNVENLPAIKAWIEKRPKSDI